MVLCEAFFPNMCEKRHMREVYIFVYISVEISLPEDPVGMVIKS
jgi:hypothetical protein